jgi:hypothetical protein
VDRSYLGYFCFSHAVLNVDPLNDFSMKETMAFTGTTGIFTYLCLLVTNSGRGISLQRATWSLLHVRRWANFSSSCGNLKDLPHLIYWRSKYCKVRMELRELVKHTSLCSVFTLCLHTCFAKAQPTSYRFGSHSLWALATVLSGLYLLQSRCVAQCLDLSPQLVYRNHGLGLLSDFLNWLKRLLRLFRWNFSRKIFST